VAQYISTASYFFPHSTTSSGCGPSLKNLGIYIAPLYFLAFLDILGDFSTISSKMSFDTEVLIIGAGMSGLGLAVQIIRKYGIRNFELIEKGEDVGGTWLANTYPGCGCDVSSFTDAFEETLHE